MFAIRLINVSLDVYVKEDSVTITADISDSEKIISSIIYFRFAARKRNATVTFVIYTKDMI
jgi:hypothetical protein